LTGPAFLTEDKNDKVVSISGELRIPQAICGGNMRIVVLGGGFGGVVTVRHLETVLRRRPNVEMTLVSRENCFVLTPLLFEACSGRLELRHCAQPILAAVRRARFIEATVESVEVERQLVRAVAPEGGAYNLLYDHLVVALAEQSGRMQS
jgi:NADH dehydrogenase